MDDFPRTFIPTTIVCTLLKVVLKDLDVGGGSVNDQVEWCDEIFIEGYSILDDEVNCLVL